MTDQTVDREFLAEDGFGYCSSCKTICRLDVMVSEPSRKHRRACKACHRNRMQATNEQKALRWAIERRDKHGGPPILGLDPPVIRT